jgi:pimeloyl-ACP methyl ester carboxylesterase
MSGGALCLTMKAARSGCIRRLAGLDVPTLLLWGGQDAFVGIEKARAIAERVPDARLVLLDDCGHLPTLERPEECVPAVRAWLTAVAQRALGAPRR